MRRKILLLILLGMILIALPVQALALGVSPGSKTLVFKRIKEETHAGVIYNNEGKDFDVVLYVEGSWKNRIDVSDAILHISANQSEVPFTYTVKYPIILFSEGEKAKIVARERIVIRDVIRGGSSVSATAALKMRLDVLAKDPDAIVEAVAETPEEGELVRVDSMLSRFKDTAPAKTMSMVLGEIAKGGKGKYSTILRVIVVSTIIITLFGGLILLSSYKKRDQQPNIQKLQSYVEKNLPQYNEETLKKALLHKNWDEKQVDDAIKKAKEKKIYKGE